MAASPGLNGIGETVPGPHHPVGIEGRLDISDYDTEGLFELSCRILQDRCFTASGRSDNVYGKYSFLVEELSVFRRDLIVLFICG